MSGADHGGDLGITAERCDRCGASAALEMRLSAGSLYLCAHHTRQHADAVEAQALDTAVDDKALVWV